jgi:hypothetical protein
MLSPDPHKSPLILQQFKWGGEGGGDAVQRLIQNILLDSLEETYFIKKFTPFHKLFLHPYTRQKRLLVTGLKVYSSHLNWEA